MRTLIIIAILNLIGFSTLGQTVEILKQSDDIKQSDDKDFAFIEPSTNINELKFVATLKITGVDKLANIETVYFKAKEKAHELGANSFKLTDYIQNDNPRQSILTIDVYNGSDSILTENFANHEKNVVYIFGNERKSNETYSFKIDNVKQELKSGTYYRHENKEGQEVKINKGGLTGATIWIKWKEEKSATFLTLTGFGLGGGPVPYGTVGLSFNTGRINYIDGNLGHLLIQLMSDQ
ncbi:MAG: hypothetical protein K2U26_19245 [Cyclobacteriaceae bacterium]|nr:hypothetical protein [Cyclobacteriaceae bacterium]